MNLEIDWALHIKQTEPSVCLSVSVSTPPQKKKKKNPVQRAHKTLFLIKPVMKVTACPHRYHGAQRSEENDYYSCGMVAKINNKPGGVCIREVS